MSPEKQQIAIAQACGWGLVPNYAKVGLYGYHNRQPSYDVAECPPRAIPNYVNSLDAMYEAEQFLTDSEYEKFALYLGPLTSQRRRAYISASASTRAEAFLRAKELWINE